MINLFQNIVEWLISNTAIVALIISFMSIIVIFISLLLQRKFIIKSFTPIPYFEVGDYEDDLFVKLSNYGTGPFIIKEFQAKLNNKVESDLISLMPNQPGVFWKTFFQEFVGVPIAPSKSINILELHTDIDNPSAVEFRENVRTTLSKVEIKLIYNNIFNKTMPPYLKKLLWFDRHN